MKKHKTLLLTVIAVMVSFSTALTLTACDEVWSNWEVVQQPTCTQPGAESRHFLNNEGNVETREIAPFGHDWEDWVIVRDATYTESGVKQRTCHRCGEVETAEIPVLDYSYCITYKQGDKVLKNFYLPEQSDGSYQISAPEKVGYDFVKFVDSEGEDFALSGTIDKNVEIYAQWQVLPTTSFTQLKQRIEAGADKILIDENIVLTDTIYITNSVDIYSTKDCTLTRNADFKGHLFVVGKNNLDEQINVEALNSVVNIYATDEATLTFDGNKENATNVYGTAFLITNSCIVEAKENVIFQNFSKQDNKLSINNQGVNHFAQVGGACFVVGDSATLNIRGAVIKNNQANIDESLTFEFGEDEQVIGEELSYLNKLSCSGGAIYNNGTVNVYSGSLIGNVAARGGAIFNYKNCNIFGGEIKDNYAQYYGGAIYLPASQKAILVMGVEQSEKENITTSITNNSSNAAGGAVFAQTVNSILIYGGVKFEANESQTSNGGAIATSSALILRNCVFVDNNANSKGGAVYTYIQDTDKTARLSNISNCDFSGNSASKGGAVGTYSDMAGKHVDITITNCVFTSNSADVEDSSTGGAIYVSKDTQMLLSNCVLTLNNSNKNGGAIYNTASTIDIVNCVITSNSSQDKGGAIAVHSGGEISVSSSQFKNNTSATNGGAIYLYGGSGVIGKLGEEQSVCVFEENSAKNGGAIYASATTDNVCSFECHYITLNKNEVTNNGGALYIYTNVVASIENLSALENVSSNYGGVMYISDKAQVTITDMQCVENSAVSGGVVYITTKTTSLTILGGSCSDNTASDIEKGYTMWSNSASVVIKIKGGTSGEFFTYETDGIKGLATIESYGE